MNPPGPAELPAEFRRAVDGLWSARLRPGVTLAELPPPRRLAPFAVAVAADVVADGTTVGTGRLVVLHDPAGQEGWGGHTRCVAFARAALEPDIAVDPLLPAVAWSWLEESLATRGAAHHSLGGTVTRLATERFGALGDEVPDYEVELRASWTPQTASLGPHGQAFADVLGLAAGLPPGDPGVVAIAGRHRRGVC